MQQFNVNNYHIKGVTGITFQLLMGVRSSGIRDLSKNYQEF